MTERSHKALQKIVTHCQKTVAYTADMSKEDFAKNGMALEAVVFNFSQIGELVKYVDDDLQKTASHINWAAMRGLRNRIIHDYDNIEVGVIWSTIQNDLPAMIDDIHALL